LFTVDAMAIALVLLPVFVGFTSLGSRFFDRGGDRHFRAAALGILLLIGLAAMVSSVKILLFGPD
jgi:hypothetical protein